MGDLRFLDLFCGCGGLALGFQDAGFKFVMGVDNDKSSLLTLEEFSGVISGDYDLFNEESIQNIKNDFGES